MLKVLNKAGVDIVMKCSDEQPKHGFYVSKGFIVVITKLTNSVTPVVFTANDIHGNVVLLNGNPELKLRPSVVKGSLKNITAETTKGLALVFLLMDTSCK